jgi:hypothetical protein
MQTLSINIQNDFMVEFMNYIENFKDKIQVHKNLNLEYDPYFYKRREQLHKLSWGVENGETKLQDWSEFEAEMDEFEKRLESKYAD